MNEMNETMLSVKAAISAFFMAAGTILGWKGVIAIVWVVSMALDYISGTAAACKGGQWSSSVARQGLWHKGGTLMAVIVAAAADMILKILADHLPLGISWPGLLLPLILVWYTITEFGSILENAVEMGANVPEWFVKMLKISLKTINESAESAIGNESMEVDSHEY